MKRKISLFVIAIGLFSLFAKASTDNCWVRPCMFGVDPAYRCVELPYYCSVDGTHEYMGYALFCIENRPGVPKDAKRCNPTFFE